MRSPCTRLGHQVRSHRVPFSSSEERKPGPSSLERMGHFPCPTPTHPRGHLQLALLYLPQEGAPHLPLTPQECGWVCWKMNEQMPFEGQRWGPREDGSSGGHRHPTPSSAEWPRPSSVPVGLSAPIDANRGGPLSQASRRMSPSADPAGEAQGPVCFIQLWI